MKKKIAFVTAVFVLVFSLTMSIGCTIAWLFTQTGEVVNTFTPSNIEITLTENSAKTFQLIPGVEYEKNPVVSVTSKTNVDIWLFVKFEENNDPSTYLEYTNALAGDTEWTQGDGTDIPADVWYRHVTLSEISANQATWHLLANDKVVVRSSLTKDDMPSTDPTLVFAAYACQYAGFESNIAGAWTTAQNNGSST